MPTMLEFDVITLRSKRRNTMLAADAVPVMLEFKVIPQASGRLDFVFPPVKCSSVGLIRAPQAEIPVRHFFLPGAGKYSHIPLLTAEEVFGLPEIQLVSDADANDFAPLRKGGATGKVFHGMTHPPKDSAPSGPGKIDDALQLGQRPKAADDLWERVMQVLQPPIDFDFKDILELPPRYGLRPYQWEGIKKLTENKSFLLGDDMGTGKTVQSILACRLLYQRGNVRRALFVAPRTVIPQWADEFGKWAPPLTVAVVQGDKKKRRLIWGRQAHVWLTTYDLLRQDVAVIKAKHAGFDLMVADEAQRIKNPQAGISKVVKRLGAISTRKWALSGTPVENSVKDLESIFDFVKPGLFNPDLKKPQLSRTPIMDALVEADIYVNEDSDVGRKLAKNGVSDSLFVAARGVDDLVGVLSNDDGWFSNSDLEDDGTVKEEAVIEALIDEATFKLKPKPRITHGDIIKPYFLRRKIEDVIKEGLPKKQEIPLWLNLTDKQQATYDTMERDRVVQMQGREITAFRILALINELKKICNRDPVSGGSIKLDWLREKLQDAKEFGDSSKFLVFTQYRQEQFGGRDYIAAELSEFGALNYGQGTRADGAILRDFQIDPDKRVFIGHPKVAGVGLNQLTVANQVVHFDHWWNPAVTNQATARAYRPGQESGMVIVYHLWVKDTIEERIWNKTWEKLNLFKEVIGNLSTVQVEEIAYEIRDELLKKHGFASLQASDTSYTPLEFEEEVCRVFGAMGFNAQLTPQSGDGGVDVIATREVGSSVEKLAIQCKHQKAPVGRPVCQQLLGVVSGDTTYSKGILVTTSTASRGAEEFVGKNGNIQIINGNEFESLRKKHILSR